MQVFRGFLEYQVLNVQIIDCCKIKCSIHKMFKNVSHHAGCLVQLSKLWSDEWAGNGNRIQFLAFLVETFLVATFLVETFLFETFLFETFLFETFLCS